MQNIGAEERKQVNIGLAQIAWSTAEKLWAGGVVVIVAVNPFKGECPSKDSQYWGVVTMRNARTKEEATFKINKTPDSYTVERI